MDPSSIWRRRKIVACSRPSSRMLIRTCRPKSSFLRSQIDLLHRWVTNGVPWDEVALRGEKKERSVNLEPLPARYKPSLALALSPDGRWLAIGRGAEIFIHDTHRTNFPELAHFTAHPDAVRALAWSPNGQHSPAALFGRSPYGTQMGSNRFGQCVLDWWDG